MAFAFTNDNFDAEVASGVALVDFFAEWCGPCHEMAPTIESLAQEYAGRVKVGKVDVDAEQALAVRFGIMSIPTLVVLKDGKPVAQFVGITAKSSLVDAIRKAEGIA